MHDKKFISLALLSLVLSASVGCSSVNASSQEPAQANIDDSDGMNDTDNLLESAYDSYVENGGTLAYDEWLHEILNYQDSDILDYYPQDDGTYAVSLEKYKDLTDITIPSSYRKSPVTTVRTCIYTDNFSCQTLTIPKSITKFEQNSLASINVKEITYEGSLEEYCNIVFENDGLSDRLYYRFWNGNTQVQDWPNIRIGGEYLTGEVTIPSSIKEINQGAFNGFDQVTSFALPDVTSIGDAAFKNCSSLKTVTMGKSCTMVGDYAFFQNTSLTTIDLGDALTNIETYAFSCCSSLKSVILPKTLKRIDAYAFENCANFSDIYFTGTQGEWDALYKDYDWTDSSPTIHYNYTR